MPHFLLDYSALGPINISSGSGVTIRTVADMIAELVGYKGTISWDTDKPDGQMEKIFDVGLLKDEGIVFSTSLERGLKQTIEWYSANYPINIRL